MVILCKLHDISRRGTCRTCYRDVLKMQVRENFLPKRKKHKQNQGFRSRLTFTEM